MHTVTRAEVENSEQRGSQLCSRFLLQAATGHVRLDISDAVLQDPYAENAMVMLHTQEAKYAIPARLMRQLIAEAIWALDPAQAGGVVVPWDGRAPVPAQARQIAPTPAKRAPAGGFWALWRARRGK